jgi:hypothetical protein
MVLALGKLFFSGFSFKGEIPIFKYHAKSKKICGVKILASNFTVDLKAVRP